MLAQTYNYQHYTKNNGLPSLVVYDVLQDNKGFIWIATKEGVSRFDGSRFLNLTTDNGLPENEIIGLCKGAGDTLYFLPFREGPGYIKHDSAYSITFEFDGKDWVKELHTTAAGQLWITATSGKLIDYTGGCIRYVYEPKNYLDTQFSLFQGTEDEKGNVWISSDTILLKLVNHKPIASYVLKDGLNYDGSMRRPLIVSSNEVYLYTIGVVAKLVNEKLVPIFSNEMLGKREVKIINISSTRDHGVLVGTTNGAYKVGFDSSGEIMIEEYLVGKTVGRAIEDREGNYWFATINDGLYKLSLNSRQVTNINADNGLFSGMPGFVFLLNDTVCISSQVGDLYVLVNVDGKWRAEKKHFDLFSENMAACTPVGSEYWCVTNFGVQIYNSSDPIGKKTWKDKHYKIMEVDTVFRIRRGYDRYQLSSAKKMVVNNDGLWLSGSTSLLNIKAPAGADYYEVIRAYAGKVTAIGVDSKSTLWAALPDGLHRYQNGQWQPYTSLSPKIMITDILPYADSGLWLATSGKGIYRIDGINDAAPEVWAMKDGLPSNVINDFSITPFGIIVSTDGGLAKIAITDDGSVSMVPLAVGSGLMATDVRQTLYHDGHLFAITSQGVSVIREHLLQPDSTPPLVYITKATIAGSDTAILPSYTLPYDKANILLEYVGLSYKSNGNLLYRYRMDGIDTGWIQTTFTNVQYPDLQPGQYTFKVDARSLQGQWSGKPVEMAITILPPYWQTWWFRLLTAAVIMLMVIAISYAVIRYYRNRSEIAQRMVELEGQALRANMNPHFIFNALNAVHDFIANQDARSAHLYLGKFAKLIRSILNQSRKDYISLEEELDTLKLYLELENMRFEHKFVFKFEVDPSMEAYDMEIPPMLIQPYLENAVRHGLTHMDKAGFIKITFEHRNDYLICSITDNGIGRKKAMEVASKRLSTHRSAGMEITQKRVELLNNQTRKGTVTITDLYHPNGDAAGTTVVLLLPIKEPQA